MATSLASLVSEVMLITKRPDLQDRTTAFVKAATLKAHSSDFYYKDLHENAVQFQSPEYIQNFVPTDIFSNFRKAKYVRVWIGDMKGRPGHFLEPIQIENSLDSYQKIKSDVFYMAGQYLQIRTRTPVLRVLFGAYLHPMVVDEAYSSWIANEYPACIVNEAARRIFKSIGQDQQSAEFAQLVAEDYAELKMSNVDDIPVT